MEQLQREITAAEFAEWIAFNGISPIGDDRRDVLFAHLEAHLANLERTSSSQRVHRVDDYQIHWGRRPEQTPEEQFEVLKTLTLQFGGTVH